MNTSFYDIPMVSEKKTKVRPVLPKRKLANILSKKEHKP